MRLVSATTRRGAGVVASVLRLVGMLIVLLLVLYVLLTALEANFGNVWAASRTAALIWWAITAVVVRLVRRIG